MKDDSKPTDIFLRQCWQCGEWTEDRCNHTIGRCGANEDAAKDLLAAEGRPMPRVAKVIMDYNADATTCPDWNITDKAIRELQYMGEEAGNRDTIGQPRDAAEWARRQAG